MTNCEHLIQNHKGECYACLVESLEAKNKELERTVAGLAAEIREWREEYCGRFCDGEGHDAGCQVNEPIQGESILAKHDAKVRAEELRFSAKFLCGCCQHDGMPTTKDGCLFEHEDGNCHANELHHRAAKLESEA